MTSWSSRFGVMMMFSRFWFGTCVLNIFIKTALIKWLRVLLRAHTRPRLKAHQQHAHIDPYSGPQYNNPIMTRIV